jgi:hypothetical protein
MNELDLEGLRKQAESWHKVLRVRREPLRVVISVLRGIDVRDGAHVMSEDIELPASAELEAFLSSPPFVRKLFSPSERGIILIDLAGYSRHGTEAQGAILSMFYESLRMAELSSDLLTGRPTIDQIIPTGDGCFIVFEPEVNHQVFRAVFSIHTSFCAHQKRLLKRYSVGGSTEGLGIRLACHVGEVDFIVDAAGNRNAYGTGLNQAAWILEEGRTMLRATKGNDPVSVAFYEHGLHTQAADLVNHYRKITQFSSMMLDLGVASNKHQVPIAMHCLLDLPQNLLAPFGSWEEKAG